MRTWRLGSSNGAVDISSLVTWSLGACAWHNRRVVNDAFHRSESKSRCSVSKRRGNNQQKPISRLPPNLISFDSTLDGSSVCLSLAQRFVRLPVPYDFSDRPSIQRSTARSLLCWNVLYLKQEGKPCGATVSVMSVRRTTKRVARG